MEVNQQAEQALLGIMLVEGDLLKEVTLQPKHFFYPEHQILFKALRELEQKNEPIDIVSVVTTLNQALLLQVGGKKYLSDLMNSIPSTSAFKTYEKYVLGSWKIRESKRIKNQEINNVEDISNLMQELSNLESQNMDEDYDHKNSLQTLYEKILNQPKGLSGIDTGFKDLNRFLNGFQRSDLIVSAARPSMGKTAKMLNHAIKHCENGGCTIIFSLEMGEDSLNKRILSTIGNIDGYKLKNPNEFFNQKDWEDFNTALGQLEKYNLHIYDKAGQTIQYMWSKVRTVQKKFPDTPMLIMIDYLQLIRSGKRFESRNVEVGEITRTLKEMAKYFDCPVYLLSQLSRGVESRQDKHPMMSDIRDSGSVEQDADVIEFLYRDDYYDKESKAKNIIEVVIAKQRNGPVGTVQLAFIKEYNKFVDLEYRHDDN